MDRNATGDSGRRTRWGLIAGLGCLGMTVGFLLSEHMLPQSQAAAPTSAPAASKDTGVAPAPEGTDSAHRWVAVIYGNVPITREELGEYLIARNADKLELLVNKRIIEYACKQRGIDVTNAEVEATLAEDLKDMKISMDLFVDKVLKQYHKSLFEWKEDVIRPKLLLSKMCRDHIQITDQDYQDAFDAYYGEKIECRLILFPKGEEKHAMMAYGDLRKSDSEFDRVSRQQASPTLASSGGRIQPIAHHTTGNEELEKEAFSLQPGEISRLIGTPEGTVVLKCVSRIPADKTKTLAGEKEKLKKEIIEKKIRAEIPRVFKELQDQAQAKLFLKKFTTQEALERDVKQELQSTAKELGLPQAKR